MEIQKLTITPLEKGWAKITCNQPTPESACKLIKERLISGRFNSDRDRTARIFRKIPKNLQGFVNPKCKISTERKFTIIV